MRTVATLVEYHAADRLTATVQKILNEILPPPDNPTTTKDFRDSLTDACVEFIQLIASEANDIAEKENKKTIACEHITHALKELEFDEYIPAIMESADEFKKQQAVSASIIVLREPC